VSELQACQVGAPERIIVPADVRVTHQEVALVAAAWEPCTVGQHLWLAVDVAAVMMRVCPGHIVRMLSTCNS
jgi:hypothetical protein